MLVDIRGHHIRGHHVDVNQIALLSTAIMFSVGGVVVSFPIGALTRRRARFSSSMAARERRIEGRIARNVIRKTSISEDYEERIMKRGL
jgi:hypothetical protein